MAGIKNIEVSSFIPEYNFHVDENVIYLKDGKLMSTLIVGGFPYEAVEDSEILSKFDTLKRFLVGLGKQGNIYLWTHIIKKKTEITDTYDFNGNNFLQGFSDKYIESLSGGNFYKTYYVISIGTSVPKTKSAINDGIDDLKEIISQAQSILEGMSIKVLGVRDGFISEISSDYLSQIINNAINDIPLSGTRIKNSIPNSDFFFGFDVAEFKNFDSYDNKFCTNYIIKDFPRGTEIGQWDFILKLPYEFVLTQSFIYESASRSIRALESQMNKLESASDTASTQLIELEVGQESLQEGEISFGSYHAVLSVFGSSFREAKDNGVKVSSEFVSSGKGFRFIKSTNEAPLTYFSHLPMSKNRPLATKRTTTNLACLFSMHNFSYGKRTGNPIGDGTAIMPLKSTSDSLYYFNTHYSDIDKNVTGEKIAGHALILGATGAGKTTFEGVAAGYLQRFDPYLFVVDFNRSTELFVRAFGGSYFSLEEGVYSGLNPFQIADADDLELVSFLKSWVKRAAVKSDGSVCDDREAIEIDRAVDAVMGLPREIRRFRGILESLPSGSDVSLRLSKWCGEGALAWALDSEINTFNPTDYKKVGFDTTVILDSVGGKDHPACEMILSVLFFYKDRMQKEGSLMLSIVEEFWKPANFPMTRSMINDALKAGRIKGEMMWLTSQSPEDAINCDIFAAIVQQTSTKVCLPNPDASWDGYKKIGLTSKEFSLLKKLGRESRTMLIKQSGSSVFAKMDLHGFDDYLPIISGSLAGVNLCSIIRKELGTDDPNVWIPEFLKRLPYFKE